MKSLLAAHLAYKKHILGKLKEYGLATGNPKIMYYIYLNEGCQQKDIAENCYVESATLSTVLSRMEKNNFIERRQHDTDKRAYSIYIKDEARHIFEEVYEVFEETLKIALEGFSDEEAKELEDYLDRVEKNMKNHEIL